MSEDKMRNGDRPYADLTDAELDRQEDEAFQWRDWQTVELLQAERQSRVPA